MSPFKTGTSQTLWLALHVWFTAIQPGLASQIRMSALRLDRNERLLRPQRNSSCASRTRYKSAGPLHDSRQFSLCGLDFQSGSYQQKWARPKQPGKATPVGFINEPAAAVEIVYCCANSG